MDSSLSNIISIVGVVISAASIIGIKSLFDRKMIETEEKEVTDNVTKVISRIVDDKKDDVLTLMIKNVGELREYYVINKQQARNSFSAALFISILGFILFATGIIITYLFKTENAIQYTTIGGAVVEIIAGLFFCLYSKAIKQINIFHTSLQSTEKFLTAIQLVDKISSDKRDETYINIIDKILSFNFTQLKSN